MKKFFAHIIKNRVAYRRVLYLIAAVVASVIVIQCIECGYDKSGFYFRLKPAGTVNVNINK